MLWRRREWTLLSRLSTTSRSRACFAPYENITLETSCIRAMALPGSHTYKYPRPGFTVDTCILSRKPEPSVLLIQRKFDPFKGYWALPGGFVDEMEPIDKAAARELQEETSVDPAVAPLTQVGAFGDPGRDPRGWTVTVAYVSVVDSTDLGVKAADDASEAQWFPVTALPKLAFDHKLVIRECFNKAIQTEKEESLTIALEKGAKSLEGDWRIQ